ncbi:hypothetical protein HO173_003187 [Letharia columbiana]|uniref:Retrotransposon gag domain-containing protein n=1 Tax=Letharia columbiana TaxID=112416 RepID=A0A8H6G1I2_9LECA|nr:uncharacterized protein HO173_003187 [Letharia columbiana]KAF6238681.1 hypothetical protein HO173_003187 [Letharia columbiana]
MLGTGDLSHHTPKFVIAVTYQESLTTRKQGSHSTIILASTRNLLEELAYHYRLDAPDFSRIPLGNSPTNSTVSSSESYRSTPSSYQSEAPVQPSTLPINTTKAIMPRPTFATCGNFSGTTGMSASKWLRKFDFDMEDYQDEEGRFPPAKYLGYLDMLLVDDASEWSESHPEAVRLLTEAEHSGSQQTIQQFRAIFCEKFPSKAVEVSAIPFDVEIADLHQRPEESLASYFKRVTNLMQRVGIKDRPAATPSAAFSLLESTMLDTILRAFIRGLNDQEIRKEATRGMASSDRSLHMVYNLAEEARRTNAEIQKLLDEESRSDQLQFYKSLVERNLPKQQVASLLASHQAAKAPRPSHYQSWSFHADPPEQLPEASAGPQRFTQSQPPEYRRSSHEVPAPAPAPAPILGQNPNKGNAGRSGPPNPIAGSRFRNYQPTPKDIPERSTSKNPYINGTIHWSYGKDG